MQIRSYPFLYVCRIQNRSWLYQHKFAVVLLLYLIFLFCVGASQSKLLKKFVRKCYGYFS